MLTCKIRPHPSFAGQGILLCILCVHVSVGVQNSSENIELINFIFGRSPSSDLGRKLFNFERMPVGGLKYWTNDKEIIGENFSRGCNS